MVCLQADMAVLQKRKRMNKPSGLPSADYWSGTEGTDGPGGSWFVHDGDGKVRVNNVRQRVGRRVVCVP